MNSFVQKMGTGLLATAILGTVAVDFLLAKGPGATVSHVTAIHASSGTLTSSGTKIGKQPTSEVPVPKRSPHQDPFRLSTSFNESEHVNLSQLGPKLPSQVLSQFNSQQTMHITAQTGDNKTVLGGNKEPQRIASLLKRSETVSNQTRSSQFALTESGINNTAGDHTELTQEQTGSGGETPVLPTPLQRSTYASPRTLDNQSIYTKTVINNIAGDHTELTDAQTGLGGEGPAGGSPPPPLESRPANISSNDSYYLFHLDPMYFSGSQSSNATVTHLK